MMEQRSFGQDGFYSTPPAAKTRLPVGKKELILGLLLLPSAWFLCNSVFFGGFNLGFALGTCLSILLSAGYLLLSGCRARGYPMALLAFALVIAAGFGRTGDGLAKLLLFIPLLISASLGLCLLAGQNRRAPGEVGSLLDAPRALFGLGLGKLSDSLRGTADALSGGSGFARKGGAFLLGLCIAVPVLLVMVPLLTGADAAFDGLVGTLPQWQWEELFPTAIYGSLLGLLLYSRGVALGRAPKPAVREKKARKGLSPVTVNTLLGTVCLLYLVYLFSQLAYFVGGFSGILPEGYSTAEYARRGFFEMAMLCLIDLGLMVGGLYVVRRSGRAPLATRLLCLGIGVMSLFFVAAASGKMLLYIGTYGLTRQRVLTQVIMLLMAAITLVVLVWLFVPRLPYMKLVLLSSLAIGSITLWADVDTVVARYNVDAFLSGRLETVDVGYLGSLSDGALLQLERLTRLAPDSQEADYARRYLGHLPDKPEFRQWNYTAAAAAGLKAE